MNRRGQILVVLAVGLAAALLMMATVVDGARLRSERERLRRVAQAAADAGASVLAERASTLAAPQPVPSDIWQRADWRATLTANPIRTAIAEEAEEYAARNGVAPGHPLVRRWQVLFAEGSDPEPSVEVRLVKDVPILLAGVLGRGMVGVPVTAVSSLPWE